MLNFVYSDNLEEENKSDELIERINNSNIFSSIFSDYKRKYSREYSDEESPILTNLQFTNKSINESKKNNSKEQDLNELFEILKEKTKDPNKITRAIEILNSIEIVYI